MAKISKIMDINVPTLKKEARISDAIKLIVDKPQGCVVIMEGKNPLGIITESDIIRNMASEKISQKEKVTRIMSSPITSLQPNISLDKANKIIDTKHFKMYPIIENGILLGLITENNVVQTINDNIRFHRNIQDIVLVLFVVFELFIFILYRYLVDFLPFLR